MLWGTVTIVLKRQAFLLLRFSGESGDLLQAVSLTARDALEHRGARNLSQVFRQIETLPSRGQSSKEIDVGCDRVQHRIRLTNDGNRLHHCGVECRFAWQSRAYPSRSLSRRASVSTPSGTSTRSPSGDSHTNIPRAKSSRSA